VTVSVECQSTGHTEVGVAAGGENLFGGRPGLPIVGAASIVNGIGRRAGTRSGVLEALAPDEVHGPAGSCCNYGLGRRSVALRDVDRFAPARFRAAESIDLAGGCELLGRIHLTNGNESLRTVRSNIRMARYALQIDGNMLRGLPLHCRGKSALAIDLCLIWGTGLIAVTPSQKSTD
jgi:hypothetical protein